MTRNLALAPPFQTIGGAVAGAGLGASMAAAGDVDDDGRVDMLIGAPGEASHAGAAYLVRGVPNTTWDLALAPASARIAPCRGPTRRRAASWPRASRSTAQAPMRLSRRPGANGDGAWFLVGGSGTPILPPPPGSPAPPSPPPAPPAPPAVPPAPPAPPPATTGTTTGTTQTGGTTGGTTTTAAKPVAKPVAKKTKKKLPLRPKKKPKAKYKIVKGKRVKVKPAPCRPRPKAKVTTKKA